MFSLLALPPFLLLGMKTLNSLREKDEDEFEDLNDTKEVEEANEQASLLEAHLSDLQGVNWPPGYQRLNCISHKVVNIKCFLC